MPPVVHFIELAVIGNRLHLREKLANRFVNILVPISVFIKASPRVSYIENGNVIPYINLIGFILWMRCVVSFYYPFVQVILDSDGAEDLLGNGDMLFRAGKSIDCIRVQCAFVDTPEIERINEFISSQEGYASSYELPDPYYDEEECYVNDVDMTHLDPLFEDAARLIVMKQDGSTSLIQRKFAIGYNRAGRLMDQLEKAGIVGAVHGSRPREVLIVDEISLEILLSQLEI